MRSLICLAVMVGAPVVSAAADDGNSGSTGSTALELFEQRLMPIFRSPNPSSCVQCHLAAVDLKDYILPSHEKTFLSLRDQGLINLAEPEKSKILELIQMGDKDLDKGARLIHAKTRRAEYEAFAAWIKACCNDPALRDLPPLSADQRARPDRPDGVIRHARKSRVVDSFVRNVWSQRMRCFPCHTPHEIDRTNPKHEIALQRLEEIKQQLSQDSIARMDIFRSTPEETLDYLIGESRRTPPEELPLINIDHPEKSLILLKPTSKIPKKDDAGKFEPPSYAEPVSHMGGLKMHDDDQSYKSFYTWLQDYARVVGDQYASVQDLPQDNWFATRHVLRMRQAPESWPAGVRVQFFVHAWNDQANAWRTQPIAFTQGTMTRVRMVAGALFLMAPSDKVPDWDREDATLPPGKYLIKVYTDLGNRLSDDPTVLLGAEDFYGETEIQARWDKGFPEAEWITGAMLN